MFKSKKTFMVAVKCYYEAKRYRYEQFMLTTIDDEDFLEIAIAKGKELVPNANWVKIEKVFNI